MILKEGIADIMKGNEIIDGIKRYKTPDLKVVRDNCITQENGQKPPVSIGFRKAALITATAAMICLIVIGALYMAARSNIDTEADSGQQQTVGNSPAAPQENPTPESAAPDNSARPAAPVIEAQPLNSFSFAAHVVSFTDAWQNDGNNTSQFSIDNVPGNAIAVYNEDLQTYFVCLGLICEGENIKNIEVSVEEGYFAMPKQIVLAPGAEPVYLGFGDWARIENFDVIGEKVSFGSDDVDIMNLDILFWVAEGVTVDDTPLEVVIRAKATFHDGTTDEVTSVINLADAATFDGLIRFVAIEAQKHFEAMRDYYTNIPLEDCELVPDSVKVFTEVYKYVFGNGFSIECYLSVELFGLGEDGVSMAYVGTFLLEYDKGSTTRVGWGDDAGEGDERGYIVVMTRDDEGIYTGMVYRTPKRVS